MEYKNNIPDKDAFYKLFETTNWNAEEGKSSDDLYSAIKNSWFLVSVYNEEDLIGFGRVISDGYLHAFIVDLIVAPQHQKCGTGSRILNCLVEKIKQAGINDIQLFCAKGKKLFYLNNNFVERSQDAPGMEYKSNYY
jgi:GNAT superfamily N-acetyltransferase